MRTFLIALPALLACGLIASPPAAAASRNFGITGFDRVRIDGPYRVKLAIGVPPFASASGSAVALDRVAIEVQGRTLIVHPNQSAWGSSSGQSGGPVEISLGTHELSAASVNGSGTVTIDRLKGLSFDLSVQGSGGATIGGADVDQLKVSIAGTGAASIAGRAAQMTAIVRGISSLDASGLVTKDATIGAEGAATVKAAVTNSAKIAGSGPATITLTGGAACTIKIAGSATVSGCK